jgi:hypothetical protein
VTDCHRYLFGCAGEFAGRLHLDHTGSIGAMMGAPLSTFRRRAALDGEEGGVDEHTAATFDKDGFEDRFERLFGVVMRPALRILRSVPAVGELGG